MILLKCMYTVSHKTQHLTKQTDMTSDIRSKWLQCHSEPSPLSTGTDLHDSGCLRCNTGFHMLWHQVESVTSWSYYILADIRSPITDGNYFLKKQEYGAEKSWINACRFFLNSIFNDACELYNCLSMLGYNLYMNIYFRVYEFNNIYSNKTLVQKV